MENYEFQEIDAMKNLTSKVIKSFYDPYLYEGDRLTATFFKENFYLEISEDTAHIMRAFLTFYIYNWFLENQDKEVEKQGIKCSIKKFLTRYITLKTLGSRSKSFEEQLEENMASMIHKRLENDVISLKDNIGSVKTKEGEERSISYRHVSDAFKTISLFMLEDEKKYDFLEGAVDTISTCLAQTYDLDIASTNEDESLDDFKPVEISEEKLNSVLEEINHFCDDTSDLPPEETINQSDEEGFQKDTTYIDKMFLFYSIATDSIEAGLFYDNGSIEIASTDETKKILSNYVSQCKYQTLTEIMDDLSIQSQNDTILSQFIKKNDILSSTQDQWEESSSLPKTHSKIRIN